jgi:methionine synthase I (cobalamin-dependent)
VPTFADLVVDRGVVLADGATGTNYQEMGLPAGAAPEEWVLGAPERVRELHRRFAAAGSDLVLTCSFGATSLRLADGPLAGQAGRVNVRAAELAREAVGGELLVAGSMGPSGQLIEPYGGLTRQACVEAYAEQARSLAAGGVDLLVLETFFALEEALWALEGVQSAVDLPLVVSFSFDQGKRTMMGVAAAEVVSALAGRGVAGVGLNCGRSLEDTDAVVDEFFAPGTRSGSNRTRACPRSLATRSSTRPTRRPSLARRPLRRARSPHRRRLLRRNARTYLRTRAGARPSRLTPRLARVVQKERSRV